MTWSTDSINSPACKQNKNVDCHTRKRFTIKSNRPSFRHRISLRRHNKPSRCYSLSGSCVQQQKLQSGSKDQNCIDNNLKPGGVNGDVEKTDKSGVGGNRDANLDSYLEPEVIVIQKGWKDNDVLLRRELASRGENTATEEVDANGSSSGGSRAERCVVNEIGTVATVDEGQLDTIGAINEDVKLKPRKLLTRSTSRRNRSKYTFRRKKSQNNDESIQVQKSSSKSQDTSSIIHDNSTPEDLSEPISLQDIKIEIKQSPLAHISSISDEITSINNEDSDVELTEEHAQKCLEGLQSATDTSSSSLWCRYHPHYHRTARRTRQQKRQQQQQKPHVFRRRRKILVIGDMMSGKSNLISAYSKDRFTDIYSPTILHCCETDVLMSSERMHIVVIEVSGRDDFKPLRQKAYRKVDAIIVCYPVDSLQSFERVKNYWVPEVKRFVPNAPFVLIGTKRDIRDEARDRLEDVLSGEEAMSVRIKAEATFRQKFVSQEKGRCMADQVGATEFFECSSLYRDTTRDIFERVTKIALQKNRRRRRHDNRSLDAMCVIV